MIHFGDWSATQAADYCDKYSAAVPGRAEWLVREYETTGGTPALRGDQADLDHLWSWLRDRIASEGALGVSLATEPLADDPQAGPMPPWQDPEKPNPYLSGGLLWIVDALGCYLAALVAKVRPDAEWNVYRSPNQHDFNQNRTQLFGVEGGGSVDPAGMVYTALIGPILNGKPWDDAGLADLFAYMDDPEWRPKQGFVDNA